MYYSQWVRQPDEAAVRVCIETGEQTVRDRSEKTGADLLLLKIEAPCIKRIECECGVGNIKPDTL